MRRALFLGIDGGGTTCRAALSGADGTVLGRGTSGPANIWTDPDGAVRNIVAAAEECLRQADLGADPGEVSAVVGLAGANVDAARQRIAGRLPFGRVRLETDAAIAIRGALGAANGICLITGTGSVFGRQRAGAIITIGGWGFRLGDHASGARLGREIIEAAFLAHDGMIAVEPLLRAILAEAGGPQALLTRMAEAPPSEYAAHARRVFEAAARGERAATRILGDAENQLCRAIATLDGGAPLPVCFLGGLGLLYAERLAPRLGGRLRAPLGTALDGALAMAREDPET